MSIEYTEYRGGCLYRVHEDSHGHKTYYSTSGEPRFHMTANHHDHIRESMIKIMKGVFTHFSAGVESGPGPNLLKIFASPNLSGDYSKVVKDLWLAEKRTHMSEKQLLRYIDETSVETIVKEMNAIVASKHYTHHHNHADPSEPMPKDPYRDFIPCFTCRIVSIELQKKAAALELREKKVAKREKNAWNLTVLGAMFVMPSMILLLAVIYSWIF